MSTDHFIAQGGSIEQWGFPKTEWWNDYIAKLL